MDILVLSVYAAAGITSLSAIIVVAVGRLAKPAASLLAICAGLAPWVFFAQEPKWIPQSLAIFIFGLIGSAPLFMAALLIFGFRRRPDRWKTLAVACTVGMCAGIGYSFALYRLLCEMP